MFLLLLIALAIVSVTSVGTGLPTRRLPSVTVLQSVSHLLPGRSILLCQSFVQSSFSEGSLMTRFHSFIASALHRHSGVIIFLARKSCRVIIFSSPRKGFALCPPQTEQGAEPSSSFSNLTFLLGCPSGFYLCL